MTETSIERAFLATLPPFDQLSDATLEELAGQWQIRQAARDETLYDGAPDAVYLIRRGAIELRRSDDSLLARLGEGELFGHQPPATDSRARAIEDSLLYRLPNAHWRRLCEQHSGVRAFFSSTDGHRLRGALERLTRGDDSSVNLLTVPLHELVAREPISLPATATIQQAARRMADERVSSMLVVEDGRLVGIVTDRDLRIRVLAAGLPCDRPLGEIMTPHPRTVTSQAYGFEALLAMARGNVHHLPVVDGERVVGMITATDLLQRRATSAIYLVGDIHKRNTAAELAEVSRQLPQVLLNLVQANATAHSIGHVISAVGEAITVRLLQLAERQLGPAPIPYAWLAAGSLARFEQTALSDQDNGLLLGNDYDPKQHGEYFESLARFVCDGLNDCGYIYCPGDVMAMNPEWRQPLAQWQRYFDRWIEQPEPKALMLSSIFFDLRPLYGDTRLFQSLSEHVLDKSRKNRIFLAYMTSNALTHQPPLGFFRNFVLVKDGEHDRTLDLKHNGVVPIVDLARIYALAQGLPPVNTHERLEAVAGHGELSISGAADLRDALEFIGTIRLQHQARRVRRGEKPDNFVPPDGLSQFERNHLKDAFGVVRTMQSTLSQRFQANRLG